MQRPQTVIGIILSMLVLGLLVMGYVHSRSELRILRRYLEQNRPDIVAAIEAYRQTNGGYPDFITNAIPRYYRVRQERLFFLESYDYMNLGTNYFLKHFSQSAGSNPRPAGQSVAA